MALQIPLVGLGQLWFKRLVETFWFWPLLLGLGGIALALGVLALDSQIAFTWLFKAYPWIAINADSARSLLSVSATAMISAASIVYSLSLLIRTIATSTLGPRLVQSFDKVRINRFTLGVQLMAFIYCLTVLYAIGNLVEKQTLAVAGGGALTIVALVYLVVFVHAVARQVHVDITIADVATSLRRRMKENASSPERAAIPAASASEPQGGTVICASVPGYVQLIHRHSALRVACRTKSKIVFEVREGDFVLPGLPLLRVAELDDLDAQTRRAFVATVALGPQRTDEQDFRFQALLLTEIALRALSPGINDVFTAVAAADHVAGVLAELGGRDLTPDTLCDDDGTPRVFSRPLLFQDIVDAVMHPLRQSGAGVPVMAIKLLQRLRDLISVTEGTSARARLVHHAELIAADAAGASSKMIDRQTYSRLLEEVEREAASQRLARRVA